MWTTNWGVVKELGKVDEITASSLPFISCTWGTRGGKGQGPLPAVPGGGVPLSGDLFPCEYVDLSLAETLPWVYSSRD